ncbi:MAG: tetratricopeptide repeat protein [Polyangia bacterium]
MAINKNKILSLAQKHTAKGQFDKAIAEFRKLVDADPGDIRTWLKMGDLYTRMGARSEATETYLKVAEHYKHSGFHLKAVAVYKQVLKLDPTLSEVYELLADAYISLGLNSEALIQLEQLADMYQQMGHADRMIHVLGRMVELNPENIATRLRIAEQLSEKGDAEGAVRQFRHACKQLKEQDRIEDFLKVAERLLYHDPSQVDVAREAAECYVEGRQYKRALAKLQICFGDDPRDLRTLEMLAESFAGLGQPGKAVSVYGEISHILDEQNRQAERREVLERIVEIDPDNELANRELSRGSAPEPEPAVVPADVEPAEVDELPSPAAAIADSGPEISKPESAAEPLGAGDLSELPADQAANRVEKILDKVEVLLKYGLPERAAEHITNVFEFDWYNIDAREKNKDLLLDLGRPDEAIDQLFVLAEGFAEEQPEGSVYYLHQILGIDPANQQARRMLTDIGGVLPPHLADEAEPAPDFQDVDIDDTVPIPEPEQEQPVEIDLGPEISAIESEPEPEPEPEDEIDLAIELEPSIEDIPYQEPEGALNEDDLEGGEELSVEAVVPVVDDEDEGEEGDEADRTSVFELDESMVFDEPVDEPEPRADVAAGDEDSLRLDMEDLEEPEPIEDLDLEEPEPEPEIESELEPEPEPEPEPEIEPDRPDIEEEIEEIEFFVSQDLVDEARGILDDLLEQHPGDPRLLELEKTLPIEEEEEEPQEAAPPAREQAQEDLASLELENMDLDDVTNDEMHDEIEQVFSQFKAGVKEQIDDTDFATHYDLGLAYREMGLLEDAIKEFEFASGDPSRAASVKMMIGMCHADLDNPKEAIASFEQGLARPDLATEEKLALKYELAKVLQDQGRNDDALELLNEVINTDPGFADVAERIEALGG